MTTTKCAVTQATKSKHASKRQSQSRSRGKVAANGVVPIRGKRRELIEALIERTTKDQGLSPEMKAHLKDDAWGKRLVDL
jgi:hypothetical protein